MKVECCIIELQHAAMQCSIQCLLAIYLSSIYQYSNCKLKQIKRHSLLASVLMHRVGIYLTGRCQGLIGGVENWRKMCQMDLSAQAEDDSFYIFANEL